MNAHTPTDSADVIVVGAGPAGSSAALHLAKAGLDVLLLEKSEFPRDKICGDGLTPRAVQELALMGIDVSKLDWKRTKGLRMHVGRALYHAEWPDLTDFPPFGMTVKRKVLDQFLVEQAVAASARLRTNTTVQAPLVRRNRVVGVTTKDGLAFEAPVVVAADGSSARLAVAMGVHRMPSRPLGLAIRTYFTSPMSEDDWLDSWLELWDGEPNRSHLLPGYGWSFPLADGTCNVGVGLPDTKHYPNMNYRQLLSQWLKTMPPSWGFTPENQVVPIRGGALPMGMNRKPIYLRGMLLTGDAAGLVNPFTGEGISYAMQSGRYAAEHIVEARARGFHTRSAERALNQYAEHISCALGSYYRMGRLFGWFISHPWVMRLSAHYGLAFPPLRMLTHRLLSDLTDSPSHDGYDRVIHALEKITPRF